MGSVETSPEYGHLGGVKLVVKPTQPGRFLLGIVDEQVRVLD